MEPHTFWIKCYIDYAIKPLETKTKSHKTFASNLKIAQVLVLILVPKHGPVEKQSGNFGLCLPLHEISAKRDRTS